jgi:hypothetical protein
MCTSDPWLIRFDAFQTRGYRRRWYIERKRPAGSQKRATRTLQASKRSRAEIPERRRSEEEGERRRMGMRGEELLQAGEWRADGCKGIYCDERVQRYCSQAARRSRESVCVTTGRGDSSRLLVRCCTRMSCFFLFFFYYLERRFICYRQNNYSAAN